MSSRVFNHSLYKLLKGSNRLLSHYEFALLVAACSGIFIIMVVTSVDVVFRYGFNSPLTWWYDVLMNYILVAVFFLTFSYTLAHHGHLAVDFFSAKFPRPVLHVLIGLGYLLAFALMSIVTVTTSMDAYEAWHRSEVFAGVILWPVWISKILIPISMLPLTLRTLYMSLSHFYSFICPEVEKPLGLVAVPLSQEGYVS